MAHMLISFFPPHNQQVTIGRLERPHGTWHHLDLRSIYAVGRDLHCRSISEVNLGHLVWAPACFLGPNYGPLIGLVGACRVRSTSLHLDLRAHFRGP